MTQQFMFTNPLTHFEIEEKGKKRFFVKGAFSSTDLDLVNDICTENCLKSMVDQINSGNIKLDFEHEAFRGNTNEEKEINKTRLPLAKAVSAEKKGKFADATWELNEGYKKFSDTGEIVMVTEEIKTQIKDEMLSAFSIAYIPIKISHKTIDGETVRLLDDVRLLNIALTGNPVNTAAQVREVFVKSMDAVEEYKREKKNNPDLADQLEVKTSRAEQERNKIRKEAVAGDGDEEDEEETKKKKKKNPGYKAYEKDGGHAHTEEEPLGNHNHPEIESRMRDLWDVVLSMQRPPEEAKSQSKDTNNYKEAHKMTEDEKEKVETETPEEKPVEPVAAEAPAEAPAENAEPLNEVKALLKAQAKLISSLSADVKALKEDDDEKVEAPETKANSKAIQSNEQTQSQGNEAKSVAGLGELR